MGSDLKHPPFPNENVTECVLVLLKALKNTFEKLNRIVLPKPNVLVTGNNSQAVFSFRPLKWHYTTGGYLRTVYCFVLSVFIVNISDFVRCRAAHGVLFWTFTNPNPYNESLFHPWWSRHSRLVPTAMKAAAVKNRTKIMSQRKRNHRSVAR